MYGSYGSYSSMVAATPLDIPSSSYLSTASNNSHCAFPSWPRGDSLADSADCGRTSSYVSDDDLACDDDDVHSISDSSSGMVSPDAQSPAAFPQAPIMTEADILEIQRQRAAIQREMLRVVMAEKERRRQQKKRSKTSKKSNKTTKLNAIAEAGE